MPRRVPPEQQYLELHGGSWRVTVTVPKAAREAIGVGRLRKDLRTDSLKKANLLKKWVVQDFQAQIKAALEKAGVYRRAVLTEAEQLAEWARLARERGGVSKEEWAEYRDAISETQLKLAEEGGHYVSSPDDPWDPEFGPIPSWVGVPENEALARQFGETALGRATLFEERHAQYLSESKVQARTIADDRRAMALLLDWLKAQNVDPFIERVTPKRAREFSKALPGLAGVSAVTANKYVSRLSSFWIWLAGHVDAAAVNPWAHAAHKDARPKAGETERPFTDAEVAKLLSGPAKPHMLDLMMIGALTGARLDAIVDLKAGDTADGTILYQARKRETDARLVPIHPDLAPVIARRCEGKHSEDWLFPEWPPVRKAGSMRERSFKTSNHFTDYRRSVGVDDVIEGKRRSLVNFHSFRRWFITKLEQAGVEDALISAIVGHKRGSITLDVYSGGAEIERAAAAIAKLRLPPLDGSPIAEPKALRVRPRKPT